MNSTSKQVTLFRSIWNKRPLIVIDGIGYLSSVDDVNSRHALAREVKEIINGECVGARMTKSQLEHNYQFVRKLVVSVASTTVTGAEALAVEQPTLGYV